MLFIIILILGIVAVKALFSASDTVFTYLNRAEIKQLSKTDKKAEKIRILMEDSNKFFGIIEVVIAGAIVSITFLENLIDFLKQRGLDMHIAIVLSVAIVTIVLSYIMLVFGGVLPKRVAKNNPKRTAYIFINVL